MENREGYANLWQWFGLDRASFLTMPRILMHEMPDEWQGKMAGLLEEYDEAFPNQPDLTTRVQCIDRRGKMVKFPDWVLNYRRPNVAEVNALRSYPS